LRETRSSSGGSALNRFVDLDAVTIDVFGTMLGLVDPIPRLGALLPDHPPDSITEAFRVEAEYYVEHSAEGRDEQSLARLRSQCTDVFNERAGCALTPEQYVGALEFELLPQVSEVIAALRARGLALAVVANWDFSLHEHLRRQRLRHWFDIVITSAETGLKKPDPAPFRAALEKLGIEPERAAHVGDDEADEQGARAAGLRFLPAPLTTAFAEWT
jgi:HAD superfamily hydrolase (TIGR01549 family)